MVAEETYPYFQCLIYIRSQFRERNTEIPIEKFRSHVLSSNTMTVLTARQQSGSQKFSQNFHWKIFSTFLIVFDVSWEMWSDSKNFVRNIRAWAYHEIGMRLKNLRLHRQLEIFIESRPTASFKFNEKKRCIFRIAKRFYKLLWICCGRIRLSVKVPIK